MRGDENETSRESAGTRRIQGSPQSATECDSSIRIRMSSCGSNDARMASAGRGAGGGGGGGGLSIWISHSS